MKKITCPFESLEVCVANHVRDWSEDHRDAWIYGIVCGWDAESLAELKKTHGWTDEGVKPPGLSSNKEWSNPLSHTIRGGGPAQRGGGVSRRSRVPTGISEIIAHCVL